MIGGTINVLAELERIGWEFEPTGKEEVKTRCPCHEDSHPSVSLNTEKGLWKCHACQEKGDVVSFLAHALKAERGTILTDLSSRYDLDDVKTISPSSVEKFHKKINEAGPLLAELRKRGITDEMIRSARLGYHDGRITIPVYDQQRRVINVRRYLPGAPHQQKMRNTRGHGKLALYQVEDAVRYDSVLIAGGELKALVAGHHLRELGIGCVSSTGGEGSWNPKWNDLFRKKDVYVCMDVDAAGKSAARKIATVLSRIAKSAKVIEIPLDEKKYPRGDLNDWFASEKGTAQQLIEAARPFTIDREIPTELPPISVSLHGARASSNVKKRLCFSGVITAMDKTPFVVPSEVKILCERDQPNCGICPVYAENEVDVTMSISTTSDAVLDLVDTPKSKLQDGVRNALGIPRCKSVRFQVISHAQVHDVRLSPQLSISSENTKNVVQPAFVLGEEVDLNTPYEFLGVLYPHPANQQATLVIDSAEETEDSLDTFAPSEEMLTKLEYFRPVKWTTAALRQRLNQIYADHEANVTRILCRRELHLAVDLAYHSVMMFSFDDRDVTGWVNVLVLGDSSQGKTETTSRLMEHYRLGERTDCKNASVAGLLGGLQQLGNKWFVSWGIIPQHDRRLVILEEVKGAHPTVLSKLTDMRSSGIAEIPKIERRRAHARTRLVFLSNPRSGRKVSSYGFGVEAVRELMGSLEDVRRFDLTLVLAEEQIDADRIARRPNLTALCSSDLCRSLVLFAWTRKKNQVTMQKDALEKITQGAKILCDKFSESIPIVDKGTTKLKVARLAVALAARTFSTDDLKQSIIVRTCHVDFVISYLDKLYSNKFFGYAEFSEMQRSANTVKDPNEVKRRIRQQKFPRDFAQNLLRAEEICRDDFQDWCELDQDMSRSTMSFFVRKHCLFRDGNTYHKTTDFIRVLKELDGEIEGNEPEVFEGEEL